MNRSAYDFLESLLLTPSPSGFEEDIQVLVKKRLRKYTSEIEVDLHGNLIATYNPKGSVRVMLAGHCDQIGLMVTHIDDKGFIWFNKIGGIDPSVIPGTRLWILTEDGPMEAIIGWKPIHLVPSNERGKKLSLSKLWIDAGFSSGAEARKKISIGDPVVFEPCVNKLSKEKIVAPGLDDRVGVFVVCEAMRIVAEKAKKIKNFPVSLSVVSTVQEEIGLRGATTSAYGVDPHIGIAVDVTHATDNPGAIVKEVGEVDLGKGPVISRGANINPVLERKLRAIAKKKKIPFQRLSAPRGTGTDANAMQLTRAGVATALIGLPNRYMHTQVEMVNLDDLESSAKLIAETVLAVKKNESFIPGS